MPLEMPQCMGRGWHGDGTGLANSRQSWWQCRVMVMHT